MVVFNNADEEKELDIPILAAGIEKNRVLRRVFATDRDGFNEEYADYTVRDSQLHVWIGAKSSGVYVAI